MLLILLFGFLLRLLFLVEEELSRGMQAGGGGVVAFGS